MQNLDKNLYKEYLKISMSICKNSFLAEEVLNNVIYKFLNSKTIPENYNAFFRKSLLNEFLMIKKNKSNNHMNLDDLFERDLAYIMDFDIKLKNEIETKDALFQAEINKLGDKQIMVIRGLLDNPDETYVEIAKIYKMDYNTFKAIVRQSFNILKNNEVLKGML